MAICAAVFDLDGTLCDTIGDIGACFNLAFDAVGFPTRPVQEYGQFLGFGIRENLRRAAPAGADPGLLDRALEVYLKAYPAHCADTTVPYDGIADMLRRLCDKGVALAVVTNKTEATAQKLVHAILPDIPFRFVWGRCDTRPLKPSAELGTAVCKELGLSPEEVLYVGDAEPDVNFAKNAGFPCVGVTWGYRNRAVLENLGADYVADIPADILSCLGSAGL